MNNKKIFKNNLDFDEDNFISELIEKSNEDIHFFRRKIESGEIRYNKFCDCYEIFDGEKWVIIK